MPSTPPGLRTSLFSPSRTPRHATLKRKAQTVGPNRPSKQPRSTSPVKHPQENSQPDIDDSERPTVQRVKLDVQGTDDLDEDESDGSEAEQDLTTLLESERNQEPGDGFLKAQNSSDAYFLAHSKSNPTSSNLFSAKSNWQAPLKVSDYLDGFDPEPLNSAQTQWLQWTTELIEDYSLMFYGLGSKRVTLNDFVEKELVGSLGWDAVVVNGFQANAHLSDLLDDLEDIVHDKSSETEHPSGLAPHKKSTTLEVLESRAQELCQELSRKSDNAPICAIMIHNLDGVAFRNPRVQAVISLLAAQPSIHLIATIDHIHAPILLPSQLTSARPYLNDSSTLLGALPFGYNFLYHHLPTHTPYIIEALLSGTMSTLLPPTIFPPVMIGLQNSKSDIRQNGPTTLKATLHVLSSLTEKAKSLFRLMAEYQVRSYQSLPSAEAIQIDNLLQTATSQEQDQTPRISIARKKLFELARSEFIASVESQMEALLVEFRDHGIIFGNFTAPVGLMPVQARHDSMIEDDEEWLWIGLCKTDLEELKEGFETHALNTLEEQRKIKLFGQKNHPD
ncbi:hypothetical protein O181_010498 [Austropuccinia psidii MF-1]|uniref:Origin recognition complex subunit 2 n=1 Tax=Austropuccinia psidii MF-1 TaxID=1389203 RepID=A0A9Q3GKF1_9BASI|nr:hypothetical protein [Austropuccinia psidii MF-1]